MVRLLMLASGAPSELDGLWLVEYDPRRLGRTPGGVPLTAHLWCDSDPGAARIFASQAAAFEYIRRPSWRHRTDGVTDRPIMAYHLATYPIDDGGVVSGVDYLDPVLDKLREQGPR